VENVDFYNNINSHVRWLRAPDTTVLFDNCRFDGSAEVDFDCIYNPAKDGKPFVEQALAVQDAEKRLWQIFFDAQSPDYVLPEAKAIPMQYWGLTNADLVALGAPPLAGEMAPKTGSKPPLRIRGGFGYLIK
jgi:hypothetical protein